MKQKRSCVWTGHNNLPDPALILPTTETVVLMTAETGFERIWSSATVELKGNPTFSTPSQGGGVLSNGKSALMCTIDYCYGLERNYVTRHHYTSNHVKSQQKHCSAIGRHDGEEGLFVFGGLAGGK